MKKMMSYEDVELKTLQKRLRKQVWDVENSLKAGVADIIKKIKDAGLKLDAEKL